MHINTSAPSLLSRSLPGSPGSGLFPRKGGGGGGGGGHGGGDGGGHSSGESGESGGAKGLTTGSSRSSSGFSLGSNSDKRYVEPYGGGGGKPFTLPSGSPYSGRLAGGGSRSQVYGTSRYGSGYPYGGAGSYIDNRPLPFVFWPISIAPNYYSFDTYSHFNDSGRPGGNVSTVVLRANVTLHTTEIYRIIGDQLSVTAVLDALVTNCSVQNTTISFLEPNTYSYPQPEQIVQWYRASTFGLSLDSYNNTAALPSNMPVSNDTSPLSLSEDTPLPSGLNATYLHCLNTTIGVSVPLVDPPPSGWSDDALAGLVIGIVVVGFLIILLICLCNPLKAKFKVLFGLRRSKGQPLEIPLLKAGRLREERGDLL
ncbi:hypothetical protein JAAARDRAFT_211857 [Jaapia argillacea MUCL 33604]|uniref:Uncharacterized protein n=1 Tax=Jaapia argillacea MUCL 33604 TaxID=933084 RepID=A0A067P654_9AGAM|nr:hypothetical protein JAAARDRAFT_211857 [Jaapia argillacea MUCL 33604]